MEGQNGEETFKDGSLAPLQNESKLGELNDLGSRIKRGREEERKKRRSRHRGRGKLRNKSGMSKRLSLLSS